MISANQLYKESKSELPFKEWLKETQKKGILKNHEAMYNMIEEGSSSETKIKSTTQSAKTKLGMTNLIGFVGLAILIYGLSRTSAE
jgi:peptidyl-tRNA hydrolase